MNWNSELALSKIETWVSCLRTVRKLEGVSQAMESMASQNDLVGFLNNPKNSQRVNLLVEDIRYALMDYQVHTLKQLASVVSNASLRLH